MAFEVSFFALVCLIIGGVACSVKGVYSDSEILLFPGVGIAAAAAFLLTLLVISHFAGIS